MNKWTAWSRSEATSPSEAILL